jgi:hypothetical protein
MAQRTITKSWEDFDGLDYRSTDLTRDSKNAKVLENCLGYKTNAIRKRFGQQLVGQVGNFSAIHNYTYSDTDGVVQEELLALNDNLWKLTFNSISVTSSGPIWNYEIAVNSATNTYRLKVYENSTTAKVIDGANDYYDLGTGLEFAPVTVLDLAEKLDALSGYSYFIPFTKTARVNGTQSGVNVITVDAGHTVSVGDIISFYDHDDGKLTYRYITATTATTITFHSSWPNVSVVDNQVLGLGAAPAATIKVQYGASDFDNTNTIDWHTWEPILASNGPHFYSYNNGVHPFIDFYGDPNYAKRATFHNANNVCYIIAPTGSSTTASNLTNKLFKYDGVSVYRCGTHEMTPVSTSSAAGAIAAGTYRYLIEPVIEDAKNNICNNNWLYGVSALEVTTGVASDHTITLTAASAYSSALDGYKIRGGYLTPASGAATTFTLYFNSSANLSHNFRVGDVACFRDSSGNFVQRNVTAVTYGATSGTITIDGAATTAAVGAWTNNAYVRLWRTESTGSTYYYVSSYPFGRQASFTIVDAVANPYSNETFSFEDAPKNKLSPTIVNGVSHNPPDCTIMAPHQGVLVLAGDPSNTETLRWSEPGDLEYFPSPENATDLPSRVQGQISGLASDTDENLYVTKAKGVYEVIGDLVTGAFNIKAVKEGDYGCSSHHSLIKIDGTIYGLGPLGIITMKDGEVSKDGRISPAIWNSTLDFKRTFACVETVTRLGRFYVPDSIDPDNDKVFVYDFVAGTWGLYTYADTRLIPSGGTVTYNDREVTDEVYNLSSYYDVNTYTKGYFGFVYREHGQDRNALAFRDLPPSYLYWDNTQPINQKWSPAWIHLGSPEKRKAWIKSSFYQFIDELEEDIQPYPVTVSINFYRDFLATASGVHQVTVSSKTEWEKVFKAINQFTRAFRIEFVNNVGGQCMHINAVNHLIDDGYKKEALD